MGKYKIISSTTYLKAMYNYQFYQSPW